VIRRAVFGLRGSAGLTLNAIFISATIPTVSGSVLLFRRVSCSSISSSTSVYSPFATADSLQLRKSGHLFFFPCPFLTIPSLAGH